MSNYAKDKTTCPHRLNFVAIINLAYKASKHIASEFQNPSLCHKTFFMTVHVTDMNQEPEGRFLDHNFCVPAVFLPQMVPLQ